MSALILALLACPPAPPADADLVWTLPAGCVAPYDLRAYTLTADLGTRRDADRARVELEGLRLLLEEARRERDGALASTADRLEDAATRVAAVADKLAAVAPPAPASSPGSTWAALGAGSVLSCAVVAFVAMGDGFSDRERASAAGVAGGLCGGGVAVLAWVLE